MGSNINVVKIAAVIVFAVLSGMARADDISAYPELPTAASFYTNNFQSIRSQRYLLAENQDVAIPERADMASVAEFKPPLLSGRKAHMYLGLGTVALAGLTMLAAPDNECEQNCASQQQPRQTSGTTHTRLARATAAMAVATVVTGLIYHWGDFHLDDGFADPDNQHVMLAGTGALLMLYAVHKSSTSSVPTSHAGIAELGAVSMLAAIKLTW